MSIEAESIQYEVARWMAKYDKADEAGRRELFRTVAVSAEHWFECNSAKDVPRRELEDKSSQQFVDLVPKEIGGGITIMVPPETE